MKLPRVVGFALCALSVAPLVAQGLMQAGQWEITERTRYDESSAITYGPEEKRTVCMTPSDALDFGSTVVLMPPRANCKFSDYTTQGNKVTWKMACDRVAFDGDGQLVFDGDTFTGTMTMSMRTPVTETHTYTGRRLGDCKE